MTGSLQTKHGKYYVVVRIPDGLGNTKAKWINTGISTDGNNKRKAQQRRIEILTELEENKDLITADILFADWLEEWMKIKESAVRQDKLGLNTFESYRMYIDKHIGPFFRKKGVTVKGITSKDIQAYYDTKAAEGQSANSIIKHNVVIAGALKEAKRKKLIRDNPAEDAILPRKEHFEGKAYSVNEAMKLLSVLDDEPIKPAVILGLLYGLRRSEVCGLRWQDIDFDAETMQIRNTVVKTKTLIEHERTKSKKSRRTLILIDDTIPYLKAIKAAQEEFKGRCINYDPDPQGHVCTNSNGKPFSPDYVSHGFSRLLERHGLPHIRFHELRHTAGSLLLNNGMSVKQIAEYLGHEKVSTTLDIYAHIDFEGKRATAQAMGNIFKNS